MTMNGAALAGRCVLIVEDDFNSAARRLGR